MLRHKRIFYIDLDGTIIYTASGKTFPTFIGDLQFNYNLLHALGKLITSTERPEHPEPYYIFIVTNQAGVEAGFVRREDIEEKVFFVAAAMRDFLFREHYACAIDQVRFGYDIAFSKSDDNYKPKTAGLDRLLEKAGLRNIPVEKILFIGDASGLPGNWSDSDKQTAFNANIQYMDVNEFPAAVDNTLVGIIKHATVTDATDTNANG
jgi:DNA 3'-phosphatase